MIRFSHLLMFSLLASCTLGPNYRRPRFYDKAQVQQSLHINGNEAAGVSLDWYRRFNDPVLTGLIEQGLRESPSVGAAVAKLRQARSSLRINAVKFLPAIDGDASYHKIRDSQAYGIELTTDYYQLGLDASWEIDIWGAGRRLTESSWALLRQAGANLDNVQLTLTAEIANNYISLRRAQEQLRISRQNLKLQEDIFDLVNTKYQVGLDDAIAYNQSKYLVETTRAQIPELESEAEAYANALTILVGKLPGEFQDALNNTSGNLVNKQFNYDLSQLYNLPVDVIRNRPDVQMSEQQLVAANAQIGQAIAGLFPSVNISAFLGWQSANLGKLITPNTDMFSLSPAVNIPLFHFGALVNNVELQKGVKAEQVKMYQASILNAAAEIRNAMVKIQNEYNRNDSTRRAVKSQEEVSELTLAKYRQGLVDFNDILIAQQNLLQSQNDLAASNAAIYQDIISFYKAVGGGYSPRFHYKPGPRYNNPFYCEKKIAAR